MIKKTTHAHEKKNHPTSVLRDNSAEPKGTAGHTAGMTPYDSQHNAKSLVSRFSDGSGTVNRKAPSISPLVSLRIWVTSVRVTSGQFCGLSPNYCRVFGELQLFWSPFCGRNRNIPASGMNSHMEKRTKCFVQLSLTEILSEKQKQKARCCPTHWEPPELHAHKRSEIKRAMYGKRPAVDLVWLSSYTA